MAEFVDYFSSAVSSVLTAGTIPEETAQEIIRSARPFDQRLIRVLQCPSLGTGGLLDRQLREASTQSKRELYSNKIFPVVPLYVSSICAEHCLYCNYRAGNKQQDVERIRLTDAELRAEAEYLVDEKGLRVLELVYATDPKLRVDAMCRHVKCLMDVLDARGGGIVGINAEALDEDEYRQLADAGLSFAVLWQETYDRERYPQLHPGATKKSNFEYRLGAYERMLRAGLRHIGMGVLSGLANWRYDWAMLMQHQAFIKEHYGVPAAILGIPRLKPASGAILQSTEFVPTRDEFLSALRLQNLFSPVTRAFVSTREDWELCLEMAEGGGCLFTFNCSTIPGGYSLGHRGYQFPTYSFDAPVFARAIGREELSPVFRWNFDEKLEAVAGASRHDIHVAASPR